MKHKKSSHIHEPKKDSLHHKKVEKILLPKWLLFLIAASVILNIVLLTIMFLPGKKLQKDLELAASRGSYTILSNGLKVITDDEDRSFSIKFAELWENKLQRMNGYVCEFPMKTFPPCSLIVDSELNILSLGSLSDVKIAGKSYYLGGYFSKFYGIDIRSLAGNSGIFKPDETDLTVYSEQFKTGLLKAMRLVYIKVKGVGDFDQLFPNGMNLASVGEYLKKFSAVDSTGATLSIEDLKQKKTALITVNVGCGACKSKCASMRDLLSAGDVNVIFITNEEGTSDDTKSFLKDYIHGEKVIFDPTNKLSMELYLGEPPCLMLIGSDLKIHFKSEISDIAKDAEPAINAFIK